LSDRETSSVSFFFRLSSIIKGREKKENKEED